MKVKKEIMFLHFKELTKTDDQGEVKTHGFIQLQDVEAGHHYEYYAGKELQEQINKLNLKPGETVTAGYSIYPDKKNGGARVSLDLVARSTKKEGK